jgi:transposase
MTVRLSDHRVSLVLRYIFQGCSQKAIARKVGAEQSTVSLWFSRFKVRASQI